MQLDVLCEPERKPTCKCSRCFKYWVPLMALAVGLDMAIGAGTVEAADDPVALSDQSESPRVDSIRATVFRRCPYSSKPA